jgi:hypothetical protein
MKRKMSYEKPLEYQKFINEVDDVLVSAENNIFKLKAAKVNLDMNDYTKPNLNMEIGEEKPKEYIQCIQLIYSKAKKLF